MQFVARRMSFYIWQRRYLSAGHHVVEHCADAADAKRENEALDIESGRACEIEKTWRTPVRGDEDWFGQAEGHRKQTRPYHDFSLLRKCNVRRKPWYKECARPYEPHILVGNHIALRYS